ncbi:MAG: hypothetical protein KF718_10020 [Polyangiaceae bacterium]|nr:hypothetical protein [Polyangiaceae bacterium]
MITCLSKTTDSPPYSTRSNWTTPSFNLRRRVLRLQRQLRAQVDEETWRLYLELEETMNERSSMLLTKLVARMSELQTF